MADKVGFIKNPDGGFGVPAGFKPAPGATQPGGQYFDRYVGPDNTEYKTFFGSRNNPIEGNSQFSYLEPVGGGGGQTPYEFSQNHRDIGQVATGQSMQGQYANSPVYDPTKGPIVNGVPTFGKLRLNEGLGTGFSVGEKSYGVPLATPMKPGEGGTGSITTPTEPAAAYSEVEKMLNGIAMGGTDVKTRSSTSLIKSIQDSFSGGLQKPVAPNLTQTYSTLRDQQGVGALEQQLNDVNAEETALHDQILSEANHVKGEQVSTTVIGRKLVKIDADTRDAINEIQRKKEGIVNQLDSKNKTVSMLMQFAQQDYENASKMNTDEYNQNFKLFELMRGIQNDEISAADKAADNARANLGVIRSSIASGNLTYDSLSPEQKTFIDKLDLQAYGMVGVTGKIKPEEKELDTYTNAAGNRVSVFYDPATKATRTVVLGKAKAETTGTTTQDQENSAAVNLYGNIIEQALDAGASPNEAVLAATTMADQTGTTLDLRNQDALLKHAQKKAAEKQSAKETPSQTNQNNLSFNFGGSPAGNKDTTTQFADSVSNYLFGR